MKRLTLSLLFLVSYCFANSTDDLKPETIWIKMEVPGHNHFYMSHPCCGDLIQIKHLPQCSCTRIYEDELDKIVDEIIFKQAHKK